MTASMAGAAGPATSHLVGVREAARQLGLNPSTISRQIARGAIPNRGTADRPMVDMDEARRARAENLDPSKQRGPNSPLFGEAPPPPDPPDLEPTPLAEAEDEDQPAPMPAPAASNDAYKRAATAEKQTKAAMGLLSLKRQAGALVGKAGVESATEEAWRSLRDRILAISQQVAGRLASMSDEREIRTFLRAELSRTLADAAAAIDDLGPDPLDDAS